MIAEILGHASLAMTKRYTHAGDERKRLALEKVCAREKVVTIWSQKEKRQAVGLP